MAVLARYSWTGFVVKNSHVASPGFQSQGGRGGTGRARMERPLAIANGEIATASGPERQDAQAGGVKRTMMTSLAVANAVMMSIGLVPRPECILSRPGADAKRVMLVQNLTAAENMSGSIQLAILGTPKVFQSIIKRLLRAERVGTAFAN
ncbi:hypothetical protein NKJ22_07065 [Mesorhizobium sp. M0220]